MTEIFIKENSILLGQFLKFSGIISNGGEAKYYLQENHVLVNNIPENRRGRKIFVGDKVFANNEEFLIRKNASEN